LQGKRASAIRKLGIPSSNWPAIADATDLAY